jgi:membrane AbrB-like protein
LGGIVIARLARIPSGAMLVPMVLGMTLQSNHLLRIDLPEWLLSMAYAVMGWRIGLGFTRQVLKHAFRALPQIMLSIVLLVGFCGGLAWLLVQHFHLDPLTAYLATSPGGMDSIAIIAASSHNVDLEFVMALQTVRLFLVIFLGPALARIIARKTITESSIAG